MTGVLCLPRRGRAWLLRFRLGGVRGLRWVRRGGFLAMSCPLDIRNECKSVRSLLRLSFSMRRSRGGGFVVSGGAWQDLRGRGEWAICWGVSGSGSPSLSVIVLLVATLWPVLLRVVSICRRWLRGSCSRVLRRCLCRSIRDSSQGDHMGIVVVGSVRLVPFRFPFVWVGVPGLA